MRRSLAILLILLLQACATQVFDTAFTYLDGQNIDVAISYLGVPDQKQQIDDLYIYSWYNNNSTTISTPVDTYTYGTTNAYGSYGASAYGTYSGQTTSYIPETLIGQCLIKLVTNKDRIITTWEYKGNELGCEYYTSQLKPLYKEAKALKEKIENQPLIPNSTE